MIETPVEREIRTQPVAAPAESCIACGGLLAEDQRYCLNCGERRSDPRVPLDDAARTPVTAAAPVAEARSSGGSGWSMLISTPLNLGAAAAGAGLLLLALLVGVLIGNSGDSGTPKAIATPRPQVITVASAGGAATTPAQSFTSDWPDGKNGYTVQLQTLPKDSTDPAAVASAKSDAQSKGATGVGALDSDDFDSLGGGNYVVYSGVFTTRSAAASALSKLKAKFPGAKVIHVTTGGGGGSAKSTKKVNKTQLKSLQKLSPSQYQKKSRKLPDKLKLPGKPPPKDNKKAGGGSKSETIG